MKDFMKDFIIIEPSKRFLILFELETYFIF